VNLADDAELCELMGKAGFKKVFVGIETPSLESLQECHKLQNKGRDLVQAIQTLQRAGMEVMGGFIVGFDNDEQDISDASSSSSSVPGWLPRWWGCSRLCLRPAFTNASNAKAAWTPRRPATTPKPCSISGRS